MKSWRSGAGMRKVVAERKVLVYAILRQLPDPKADLPSTHASVLQSIRQLEDWRRTRSPPNRRLQLTNTQLQEELVREYGNASKFEQEVLGWPVPPSMQHGNPKHRAASM